MRAMIRVLSALIFIGAAGAQDAPPHKSAGGEVSKATFSLTALLQECIPFSEVKADEVRGCRVSDFKAFGAVEGQTYYYALYCVVPTYAGANETCSSGDRSYWADRGLAVFVQGRGSGDLRLLFERVRDIGAYRARPPQIVSHEGRTILYLPIEVDGTGHFNESEYYLREAGVWQRIEAEGWKEELKRRIPAGLGLWKGIWPDVTTLKAEAGLYRDSDANCCPSGGTARIQLAIRRRRFVIESVTIEPGQ
jgi:hypothetical protein